MQVGTRGEPLGQLPNIPTHLRRSAPLAHSQPPPAQPDVECHLETTTVAGCSSRCAGTCTAASQARLPHSSGWQSSRCSFSQVSYPERALLPLAQRAEAQAGPSLTCTAITPSGSASLLYSRMPCSCGRKGAEGNSNEMLEGAPVGRGGEEIWGRSAAPLRLHLRHRAANAEVTRTSCPL